MSDTSKDASGRATFPVGIAGEDLRRVERDLPAGEPTPWPPNADLAVVGKRTRRIDGRAKVTGAARYTCDVRLRGMLHARRIVSTVPHARITAVDTSRASWPRCPPSPSRTSRTSSSSGRARPSSTITWSGPSWACTG